MNKNPFRSGSVPAFGAERLLYWLILATSLFVSGCYRQYYQTNTVHEVGQDTLISLANGRKYFILHANHYEYSLKNIRINDSSVEGTLDSITAEHGEYLHPQRPTENRFLAENAEFVLDEVHLYTNSSKSYTSPVSIPFKDLRRMDVYSLDKRSTHKSKVGSNVAMILTAAGVIAVVAGIITEANKSSSNNSAPNPPPPNNTADEGLFCSPLVFVRNENSGSISGTLCSGAIYASLEREDWLPLSVRPDAGDKLDIIIKGTRNEELHFQESKLIKSLHREDQRVLIDRQGKIHTIANPVLPNSVSAGDDQDHVMQVNLADNTCYSFTNQPGHGPASDLTLEFCKPLGVASAKLLIGAKNSAWAYYVFRQYKALYGEHYNELIHKKDSADPGKVIQCELDQYLPMLVSVRIGNEWKYLDYFPTPGTTGPRDLVMNLDLSGLEQEDRVQIKLQTTYKFWDLDYAVIDFSPDSAIFTEAIEPRVSLVSDERGALKSKSYGDGYITITDKEQLILEFNIDSTHKPGMRASYFLAGKGYYHDNTHFPGKPNLAEIARFSGKGAFDRYSRKKMIEFQEAIAENK